MKNKPKLYNWHFWIPDYEMQIVITNGSYHGAKAHLKDKLEYFNRPAPKYKFQFGELCSNYNKKPYFRK